MEKYVFFDFNGTIIDDLELCFDLLNKALTKLDKKTITLEKYKEIFRFPIIEYYKLAGFSFPEDDFGKLSSDFVKDYKRLSVECKLNTGIEEILIYLKSKDYILVCLSASEINLLKSQLKFYKLDKYFTSILGIDNFHASGKVQIGMDYINSNTIKQ